MPELPEVETVRRGLEAVVLGGRIDSVQVNRTDLRVVVPDDFRQVLSGQVIRGLIRRGKYIIFELGSGAQAVLHLGMSGRVRIFGEAKDYEARKHDHILITMDDGGLFAFEDPRRFGMFYLTRQDYALERPFSVMGPEPLGNWSGGDLYKTLSKKKANIKTALLDQRVVSGLGNIYVCEVLYDCGVHPERLSNTLSLRECEVLARAVRCVLERAIDAGGSTLRDYQKTDGSLGYFQYQFNVYDQKGNACPSEHCDSNIFRIVQAGRSTFFCPTCQR